LRVHYVPMVSFATGRVAGFEALVRWEHPERGLLFPAAFLSEAERSGLIVPIGTWVLEEACRQMTGWRQHVGSGFSLSVNVSARQCPDPTFAARVEQALEDTALPPGALWLEATEDVLRSNAGADSALQRLGEHGVRLVVDDCGAGSAGLA